MEPSENSYDDEDFLYSFRNLDLGEDESSTSNEACSSLTNNGGGSPLNFSSTQTQRREESADYTQFNRWMNTGSIINSHNNIWAFNNLPRGGGALDSNQHFSGSLLNSMNHPSNHFNYQPSLYNSVNQPQRNSMLNNLASVQNPRIGNRMFNNDLSQSSIDLNQYPNHGFEATRNNGLYPGTGYYFNPNLASSSSSWTQHGGDYGDPTVEFLLQEDQMVLWAMDKDGSQRLQKDFQEGNNETKQMIFWGIFYYIPEVMTDQYGHHLFQKVVDACNDYQLGLIVNLISSQEFFIAAACQRYGSHSVQRLIKQLKKSDLAFTVTSILSTKFCELMTNNTGRHVIRQCLVYLSNQANEVLFEEAITHCSRLATHELGCITLNECLDCITGDQRERLLHRIADESAYLSNNPSGNFCVQHVLTLHSPEITAKICRNLRGEYIQLSAKKGGSHVVEKCIKASDFGMLCVVEEFLENKKELLQLARDPFGNYVIQTVLKATKRADCGFYESLVSALEPYFPLLERSKTGKNVVDMIRGGIPV